MILKKIVNQIKESDVIVFYTGAGMSVASGIPTFRGKYGLWMLGKNLFFYTLCISICIFTLMKWFETSQLGPPVFILKKSCKI